MKVLAGPLRFLAMVIIGAFSGWLLLVALFAFLGAAAEGSGGFALIGTLCGTLAIGLVVAAVYIQRRTWPSQRVVLLVLGGSLFVSLVFSAWWYWEH